MTELNGNERGDWSYVASFAFALALLAAVVVAVDGEAVAGSRARLWSAVTVAARAGVRCLAPAPAPTADTTSATCVDLIVDQLLDENLGAAGLDPVAIDASVMASDSVQVAAVVSLSLPLGLPGAPSRVSLSSSATAILLPATTGTTP